MKNLLLLLVATFLTVAVSAGEKALWCPDVKDGCKKLAVGPGPEGGFVVYIPDSTLIQQPLPFWIGTVSGAEKVSLFEVDIAANRAERVKPGLRRQLDFVREYPYTVRNPWRSGDEKLLLTWNGSTRYLIWIVKDVTHEPATAP